MVVCSYSCILFGIGLAMNQIELEKIADTFDKDRSGMIDLSEIIGELKGSNRKTRRPVVVQEAMTDSQKIENEVSEDQRVLLTRQEGSYLVNVID